MILRRFPEAVNFAHEGVVGVSGHIHCELHLLVHEAVNPLLDEFLEQGFNLRDALWCMEMDTPVGVVADQIVLSLEMYLWELIPDGIGELNASLL